MSDPQGELTPATAPAATFDRSQTLQGPVIPFAATDLVQFDQASGEILNVLHLPAYMAGKHLAEPGYLAGKAGLNTHYVDVTGPTLKEKTPGTPIVNGHDITGLPIPTRASLFVKLPDGMLLWQALYDVDDGALELTFAHPGTYVVSLRCAPWLKTEIELIQE